MQTQVFNQNKTKKKQTSAKTCFIYKTTTATIKTSSSSSALFLFFSSVSFNLYHLGLFWSVSYFPYFSDYCELYCKCIWNLIFDLELSIFVVFLKLIIHDFASFIKRSRRYALVVEFLLNLNKILLIIFFTNESKQIQKHQIQ